MELILTEELAVKARAYQFERGASGKSFLACSSREVCEHTSGCMARRPPFDVHLFTFDGRAVADRMREVAAAARAAHHALEPLLILLRANMRAIHTDYRRRQIARRKRRR